jgi:iron complex transport system ATP-binding protein
LLRADNVVFSYAASPVVRDVSLNVPRGSLIGIIGPNGSGKTTLLRLLAGTRRPASGQVTLDGVAIGALPRSALAQRIAVVPQETHLAFDYSVLEVVLMGRYAHLGAFAVEGPQDIAIARAALAATGTQQFESRSFSTLSGGEKQRVIIAAALAQITVSEGAPRADAVLLLDEPTAALDLKYQIGVGSLLHSLHRSAGLTIVISTHDLAFAADLCSAMVMLRDGRVMASGPTDTLLTPESIRQLFDVDVALERLHGSRQVAIVPLRDRERERPQ